MPIPGRLPAARSQEPRPDPQRSGPELPTPNLRDLLAGALHRLGETTGCTRVSACAPDVGDGPAIVASIGAPADLRDEDRAALTARSSLWSREAAIDLGERNLPASIREFADRHGFGAAVPLSSSRGDPIALLLVGGPDDPPGGVRPRTLAALDDAARRLGASAEAVWRPAMLDDELRRLSRLASLGNLLAEAVHEIRNPLVSFKTFLQLLPERGSDPEFNTNFRALVERELERLERLLDGVLEHARPPALAEPGEETSVLAAIENTTQLLEHRARELRISLTLELPDSLPCVAAAPDAIRQVVFNLVLNALEATPSDGSVTVRGVERDTSRGRRVELSVDDTGPGVARDHRAQLFEPFFSTRADRPGGLGLAICRSLVEATGGSIEVGDAPGGGCRFVVQLPVAAS